MTRPASFHRPTSSRSTVRPDPAPWRWLYATEAGVVIDGPAVRFATEAAAQQWLDLNADALSREHIVWVNLLDGEHVVEGLSLR